MKNQTLALLSVAACSIVSAHAQETIVTTAAPAVAVATSTTTAVTNTAGAIQEFTPASSRLIVRSSAGAPVTYTYSKRTTFVDAAGNAVSLETIRPGERTTVYYAMEAGRPVVTKVVVNRTAAPAAVPVTTVERTVVPAPAPAPVISHVERTTTTTTTTGGK